jgi:hypothetical protein
MTTTWQFLTHYNLPESVNMPVVIFSDELMASYMFTFATFVCLVVLQGHFFSSTEFCGRGIFPLQLSELVFKYCDPLY